MELTTVKELFSDREKYLDKEVQVGGWIRSIRDSKAFGFIVLMMERALIPFRSFTTIQWKTLRRFPN